MPELPYSDHDSQMWPTFSFDEGLTKKSDDPKKSLRLLVITNNPQELARIHRYLEEDRNHFFEVRNVENCEAALECVCQEVFDAILIEVESPVREVLAPLAVLNKTTPLIPILMIGPDHNETEALAALQQGVADYLAKGDRDARFLPRLIRYAIERKRIEKELRLTLERYRTIFDNSAVAITVVDSEERIVSWNPFAEKLLGMRGEDLRGRPVETLYPAEEWKKIRSQNIREKGLDAHLETQVIKKDGTVSHVDLSLAVLKDGDKVRGAIGVMKDITERKMAERALQFAEERYRTIFENSAAAITVTNAEERIVSWNRVAEELLGMDKNDLYLYPVQSLYPEKEWEKIRSHNIRQKGMHHRFETKMIQKSGKIIDVAISISVLKSPEGEITGSIGIFQDISDRKALERMKDEFVDIVSHELRTPMYVIREGLSQMIDGTMGALTDDQKRFLNVSLRNVERLTRIINNLLDVSRIEAGKVELERSLVEMTELVKGIKEGFEGRARQKGIQLLEDYSQQPIRIYADADKLNQILTNLIGNAIKFTERGYVRIAVTDHPDHVECSVSDTGRGMHQEELEKIFNRFQQFGSPNRDQERGSGLGLSICKGLVELHRGKIRVTSQPGKGSEFVFSLPKLTEKEILEDRLSREVEQAAKFGTGLSVLAVRPQPPGRARLVLGEERMRVFIQDLEAKIRASLRRRFDVTVACEGSVYLLLPDTAKANGQCVGKRLEEIFEPFLRDWELEREITIDWRLAAFPEDGLTARQILDSFQKS